MEVCYEIFYLISRLSLLAFPCGRKGTQEGAWVFLVCYDVTRILRSFASTCC